MVDVYNYIIRVVNILTFIYLFMYHGMGLCRLFYNAAALARTIYDLCHSKIYIFIGPTGTIPDTLDVSSWLSLSFKNSLYIFKI